MATKKGNWVTYFLMLLLILALGGFGVTNFRGSVQTVVTVGDTEVSTNDYARAVQAQMNNFQRRTGQQMNFQQAQALGIDRVALGQLITDAAIENETARIGISAGDANVAEEIQNVSSFHNVSGEFDRQTYELALRQNGVTADEFENNIRTDLAQSLLRRAIGAGIETPDVFVDTLYMFARETRDVTWARLTADDLPEPVAAATEGELSEYHAANPAAFTRPETKTIRYAWLTPEMLAADIEVDEEQARALYEVRSEEFNSPERRLVERLVFADDAAAQAAKDRLDAGEATFEDLVDERGLSLADIDLGDVAESELGAAAADVFALTEPGVIGPLPSNLGPALFRMNGILAAEEISFEEARPELEEEAAADRARRIILDLVPQVEDLLAGGADMALLAERTDMQEGTIDWNVEVFDGIAAYEGFRSAAAAAAKGAFPEIIELDDGGILSLTVEDVQEPALRPLEDVRDTVAEAWTREKEQEALTALAESYAAQLREGREMAGLDLALNTNRTLTRDGFVEGTPPDFTRNVFELESNGISVLAADGDAWLVRLDAINEADSDGPEAILLKTEFAAQTQQEFSNAITGAVTQALVDQAGVDINSAAVTAVNSQLP